MKTTIENEEGVPIEYVTNMDEVRTLMNLFHILRISCKMFFIMQFQFKLFPDIMYGIIVSNSML